MGYGHEILTLATWLVSSSFEKSISRSIWVGRKLFQSRPFRISVCPSAMSVHTNSPFAAMKHGCRCIVSTSFFGVHVYLLTFFDIGVPHEMGAAVVNKEDMILVVLLLTYRDFYVASCVK